MTDVEDISGSYFACAQAPTHIWRKLSADGELLAVIANSPSGLYRLAVHDRQSGAPQWKGTWWTEREQSLTDSLEHAQQMADKMLQSGNRDSHSADN
jgi:hypothetical protein